MLQTPNDCVFDQTYPKRRRQAETLSYFLLAILGFSFWFFMALPFASHRESYWWLAGVRTQPFSQAFSVISVTYRPLAQGTAWLGFLLLNPSEFPTSVVRQVVLQGFIYGMFVLAWWLVYSTAVQRRAFAVIAFVAGGVFFSGYVHLFHIYGIFYVPVMLTVGFCLRFYASAKIDRREVWLAAVSILLVFWHPFATALFLGFYVGFYLDTLKLRTRAQHVRAVVIMLAGAMAIVAMVMIFPRPDVIKPLQSKLAGFLESYRTNEVNWVAAVLALLVTQLAVFSMAISLKLKLVSFVVVSSLSFIFLLKGVPLLLLWICVVLIKLLQSHRLSLLFLMVAAGLLPLGAGIGGPVSALFAIIVASYATALDWPAGEEALSFLRMEYVAAVMIGLAVLIAAVRVGVSVPMVSRFAAPLLTERERTYQLEKILAWLHSSDYCGYDIAFHESAGSPIDSLENVSTRLHRPPAAIEDVQLFWNSCFRCQKRLGSKKAAGTVVVTFGEPSLADLRPVFEVKGRYAGAATAWVQEAEK